MSLVKGDRARGALEIFRKRLPYKQSTSDRIALEEGAIRELGFFAGKQHAALLGNQLVDVPPREHEIRYKANFVKPAVLRAVAKLMELAPKAAVAPPDGVGSARAREISRISEGVLRHIVEASNQRHEMFMVWLWAAINGTAFLKNVFDPEGGDPERFYWVSPEDKTVVPDQYLSAEDKRQRDAALLFDDLATGEVSCEACSLFQIYPDNHSRRGLDKCRWIFQVQYLDREFIAEKFGVDPDDIKTEPASGRMQRWEESLALMSTGTTTRFYNGIQSERERKDRAWFGQMWERRSKAYPKGRYVAIAGETVLRDNNNPYVGDPRGWCEIPFVKVDWTPMPGRFWGLSLVNDLMNPQFRYNESRSRMAEFERIHGRAAIFVPTGSGITPGMMTIQNGAVYEYNPAGGGKPEAAPAPQLPPEVAQNAATARSEIGQLSAQSDIEGSKMPGQLRSGQAWAAMQHEQDITLTVTTEGLLRAHRDCGRQSLAMAKMFYDAPRIAKYRGPSGDWAIMQFQSADLSTDVHILGEPGEIETTYAHDRRILEMAQALPNLFADPKMQAGMLKALRFHTEAELVDDVLQHEAQQEEEMRRMIANFKAYLDQPFPVLPFEDDTAHKRVLLRTFTNLEEMDRLNNDQKAVLMAHWTMHDNQERGKQMQQLQMLQATQGTPGAPGKASQPRARAG